jgi:hypothetical protein
MIAGIILCMVSFSMVNASDTPAQPAKSGCFELSGILPEDLVVDEGHQVAAGLGHVVVDLAVPAFGRRNVSPRSEACTVL